MRPEFDSNLTLKQATVRLNTYILCAMACFVFCACLANGAGDSALLEGFPFRDSDDVMRMVQVIELKEGADWYDLTQERMNPPHGIEMHWSRLPDIPLVIALAIAEQFLARNDAIAFVAATVPPLLGVIFFFVFVWSAVPLVGKVGIPYAAIVGAVLWVPFTYFSQGRIDHHGWQLILGVAVIGGVLRTISRYSQRGPLMLAAFAGALGLWVGAEAVVPVGTAIIMLTTAWILQGGSMVEHLRCFGMTLGLSLALIFPLAVPAFRWLVPTCDSFSIVSVGFGFAIAVFVLSIAMVERRGILRDTKDRIALAGLLGSACLIMLLILFPICLNGPFGELSVDAANLIKHISEAQPMLTTVADRPALAAILLVLPCLAFAIALFQVWHSTSDERHLLWIMLLVLTSGGIAVAFYQVRGAFLANAYAGLTFVWLAAIAGRRVRCQPKLVLRIGLRAGPALMVAMLPFLASVSVGNASGTAKLDSPGSNCNWIGVSSVLRGHRTANNAPLLVAGPVDGVAALLLTTPHHVLGAVYHRNTEGLKDTIELLYGDVESAKATIVRRGVGAIVICRDDEMAKFYRRKGERLFYDQLMSGENPTWLKRVDIDSSVSIYFVNLAQ